MRLLYSLEEATPWHWQSFDQSSIFSTFRCWALKTENFVKTYLYVFEFSKLEPTFNIFRGIQQKSGLLLLRHFLANFELDKRVLAKRMNEVLKYLTFSSPRSRRSLFSVKRLILLKYSLAKHFKMGSGVLVRSGRNSSSNLIRSWNLSNLPISGFLEPIKLPCSWKH